MEQSQRNSYPLLWRRILSRQNSWYKDGAFCFKLPGLKVLSVIDPNLAQFLMSLPPDHVKKAGLSDEVFGDDPHGFMGGLLFDEGEQWHKSRKILSERFNLAHL